MRGDFKREKAAKPLRSKDRCEAAHISRREVIAVKRFQKLMKNNAGKLVFAGLGAKAATRLR